MDFARHQHVIETAWETRESLNPQSAAEALRGSIAAIMAALDAGTVRVADPEADWQVRQWVKKAILLSFRLTANTLIGGGPEDPAAGSSHWWDKVPPKFAGWTEAQFSDAGFRAVPGAIVRHGAYIAPDVVLMPSFVNVGAHVGRATMVDTWVTVGSCAQIGSRCHLSGGVGIGGVLEPLQADPVIVEDDCFIGARSEIVEGVRVGQGAVIAMGVFIGASTRIVDRETGETITGRVPAYSVVVPGSLPGKTLPDGNLGPGLACAVIVKRVDAQTRAKTSINELLRS